MLSIAPASPPDNVNATVISSTEIQVTWGIVPPIDQNGIITMYEVLYQPLETFSGSLTSAVMNSSQNSALLADLQEFVLYNISVRAYTNVGEGPFSEQVVAMTLEDSKLLRTSLCCFCVSDRSLTFQLAECIWCASHGFEVIVFWYIHFS